jgi:hypothetical protein
MSAAIEGRGQGIVEMDSRRPMDVKVSSARGVRRMTVGVSDRRAMVLRRLSTFAAILLVAGMADLCRAQSAADPRGLPIPNHSAVDQNGIDMGSGRYASTIPGPTVGSDDLELGGDVHFGLEGVGIDSWSGYVSIDGPVGDPNARVFSYTVHLAGATSIYHMHYSTLTLFMGDLGGSLNAALDTYTARDGTTYVFNGPYVSVVGWKMLGTITKPNGETISLHYSVVNNVPILISVVSTGGYMRHYENGVITALNRAVDYCDPAATHCTLSPIWPSQTWTAVSGSTTNVTDSLNRTTQLIRSTSVGAPASVIYPSGKTLTVTYGSGGGGPADAGGGRIATFSDGTSTWNYGWQWDPPCPIGNTPPPCDFNRKTVVGTRTDPNGKVLTTRSISGGLAQSVDELLRKTSYSVVAWPSTDYTNVGTDAGKVTGITYPEQNSVAFPLDGRGNHSVVTSTSKDGTQTITQTAVFPTTCSNVFTCNEPTAIFDGLNNETDYAYYDWGGVKSKLGPAVNGVRPLIRYFYAQMYAFVKNATGSLVAAEAPIWRLTQTIECKQATNAAGTACGSSADEVVTNYEYGAVGDLNALLIHGRVVDATGAALRTCYGYDAMGNKIFETTPGAVLAHCP